MKTDDMSAVGVVIPGTETGSALTGFELKSSDALELAVGSRRPRSGLDRSLGFAKKQCTCAGRLWRASRGPSRAPHAVIRIA